MRFPTPSHGILAAGILLCSATPAVAQDAAGQLRTFPAPPPFRIDAVQDSADPRVGPEPTVWGGVKYFATALGSDAWATVTSPLNLRGRDAWIAGGVLAAGALLYAFDEPIYEEIERSRTRGIWRDVEDIGETFDQLALMGETAKFYVVGMIGGHVLDATTGRDGPRHIFEELLISHWIAGAMRKAVGRPLGRMRPEQELGAYHYNFWDGTSFPSGHSSTITQVATVTAHHVDWWPAQALFYAAAGTVIYERVSSGKHWASDSLLGAAWGWAVARLVIGRREADRIDFVPAIRP